VKFLPFVELHETLNYVDDEMLSGSKNLLPVWLLFECEVGGEFDLELI
jgi:hypothetical protein